MSSPSAELTPDLAARFAAIALGHVGREYPHKLDHVLDGDPDARTPRDLHPIFFGSFDWHSCVHGYWTLATLLRLFPDLPHAGVLRALFDAAFTPEKVAAETAYLARLSSRGFERPYGWAWLLKLQAELLVHDEPWSGRLRPLADAFVARFNAYLPLAVYPVRTGVHSSTAFALALAADYGRAADDDALINLLRSSARAWHADDRDAAAWEPSGEDFLSPTLITAVALGRLLPEAEYADWLTAYLPRIGERRPASLFAPATVSDRSDGKIAHLDGLNLSRAWCWRELAPRLAGDRRAQALEAADVHLAAGLPHVAGDYMGEHWLASFALLALTAPAGR